MNNNNNTTSTILAINNFNLTLLRVTLNNTFSKSNTSNFENNDKQEVTNFFELSNQNEENFDDEIACNCKINTWRKDYFQFLHKKIYNSNKIVNSN